jgi:hypothetical protein
MANGRNINPYGYARILLRDHPKAQSNGYVSEHTLVAEKILGKPLPVGACVHHINEQKSDNRPESLVICENRSYHIVLHRRMIAKKESGVAGWRKCGFCHQYDDPIHLEIQKTSCYHSECINKYHNMKRGEKL